MDRPTTLWSSNAPDQRVFEYTTSDDRQWDSRLLRWDVLGSLGHIEGLRAARLITRAEYDQMRRGLREIFSATARGGLQLDPRHEDVHTAVEYWLTSRAPGTGERLHTGRSRNDQVACDLRLFLKDQLLQVHSAALALAAQLVDFAQRHRTVLWPGYTHGRRAMPSSVGLWAGALAEGLLDTVESLPALWARVDRSPLGSAAGYGVPLPLERQVVARALGFGGLDLNVATVQGGRGKLEAAVLFWCTQLGHDVARLSQDVIVFSGEEFGYLTLPPDLATGSSIMPHKRNPDLFELTRGRAAAVEGDLLSVLQIKAKLSGGYHRDFQLLKEPLMRGLDRTGAMLEAVTHALPRLGVDQERCQAALAGGALATDEVMRRVEQGRPFRAAYREVASALKGGEIFEPPAGKEIISRRRSTGGLGNLGLPALRTRIRKSLSWGARERRRFDTALRKLAGNAVRPSSRPPVRP
ncbi:MAG TPA: argininosuccinate lyase [Gemmatimonadales bacterium]|nr:argininosuccinate lyase [Gemmatimonadales bacterium]